MTHTHETGSTAPDAPGAQITPARSRPPAQEQRRWTFSAPSLIPSLLALAAMLLCLYPSISAWIVQYNQSQVIAQYKDSVGRADPSADEQLALAHRYNDALNYGAVLKATTRSDSPATRTPSPFLPAAYAHNPVPPTTRTSRARARVR